MKIKTKKLKIIFLQKVRIIPTNEHYEYINHKFLYKIQCNN